MSDAPDGPSPVEPVAGDDVAGVVAERDRLRAEVDDLRGRLSGERTRRRGRVRQIATAVLVVVTSLVVTVAVAGVWARRNVLNTDRFVGEVGPVVEDPAVQAALGNWITDELMSVLDPEEFFESVLPDRGQVLAVPLSNALRGFIEDEVDTFLASDTFQNLWVELNRRAHARAVDVLEGDIGDGLQIEGDQVVLNLVPVLNQVLAAIGDASPEIFGRTVDLPTITVDEVPEQAIERLESALGRDIPDDFGQFTVFEASRLRQAQDAVDLFNRLVVLIVVASVVLIGLCLWLAPRRRRTLLQLAVGIALGLVVVRRLGLLLADDVVGFARPENRDAVRVAVDAFVSTLMTTTAWVLALAGLVVVVAAVTGPYPWARALRRGTGSLARVVAAMVTGAAAGGTDDRVVSWVATHRAPLQVGGVVVAIVVLLVADLSWAGFLLLAVLAGAWELAVGLLADRGRPPEPTAVADVGADPAGEVGTR